MHNPVVLESGCKGPFYSNKWFWSVISHFISFSFKLSISFCLYLFRDCSFLSLRDPRKTELLQMRLSVGCCRSCFPASFSCEGRGGGKLFSEPSSHVSRIQAWKHTRMHPECAWNTLMMHTRSFPCVLHLTESFKPRPEIQIRIHISHQFCQFFVFTDTSTEDRHSHHYLGHYHPVHLMRHSKSDSLMTTLTPLKRI